MKRAILVIISLALPVMAQAEASRTVDCQISITGYSGETLYEKELSGILSPSHSWPITQDLPVIIGDQKFTLKFHMTYLFGDRFENYTYTHLIDASSNTTLVSAGAETSQQATLIHANGDNRSLMADGSWLGTSVMCKLGPVRDR